MVTRVDEKSELRVRKLEEDSVRIFPWGSAPRFSPDGRWLTWTIGLPPEERERLEESDEPIREQASVMDLQFGETREYEAVSEQRFDASGRFVALRGYPPDEPSGKGADLRIITLETGTETSFGNVSEMAWSPAGSLLALAIATGTDVGNGVQVYDASAGILRSADASGSAYRSLRWRHDSADLAALRSSDATSADGTAYDVLAWRDLDRRVETMVLGANTAGIPDTLEAVHHRAPAWSDDGSMISLGLRSIEKEIEKEEDDDPGDGTEDEPEPEAEPDQGSPDAPASDSEPDLPALQIWHTGDVRLFPEQQVSEDRDNTRSLLAVWHLDDDRVVVLGSDLMGTAQLLHGWEYALEDIDEPYPWGAMFGRPYHDVRAVDADTGERRQLLARVRYEWPSAGGDWLLSWDGSAYHSLHVATGEQHDLTSALAAEFADTDYDTPTDVTPPRDSGPGGWLEDDNAVLLYDEHDIWRVAPDGSGGERLTRGSETGITHRLTRVTDDDDEPGLDPDSRPYLSLYNEKTEQRGYARFTSGWLDARDRDSAETLVLEDGYVGGLVRADSADVLFYRDERFDDPPDYFVAGPDLADPAPVTGINPFIDEVAWGRAELVDFVSFMGALHWNPGVAELSHWETGQARMEVPFWEDPEAHRRNSPIHEVHNMETPLLMAFGDEDGVVDWDQGTEFFNFARRAGKQMVLLVYEGEDHGFREEANQKDYHRRILEWFEHYLKGEPPPAWITDGVALDALEEEKKRVAAKPPGTH
ncbi:prolyl oligopeptidase family serine peptidase [Candidatus Palauibacter sp.]|uniref:S9 family peptidase n=1 Tax=Candidatus Palauibacter sp. TaxID=3101350 RepID=UPI003B012CA3